jgi:hypothetical protein
MSYKLTTIKRRRKSDEVAVGTLKEGMLVNSLDLIEAFKTLDHVKEYKKLSSEYYSYDSQLLTDIPVKYRMKTLLKQASAFTISDNVLVLEVFEGSFCKVLIQEKIFFLYYPFYDWVLTK